ncbi:MAG: hypothetical protein ACR2H0_01615 [Candidatus Limnocylindrales bacterium]
MEISGCGLRFSLIMALLGVLMVGCSEIGIPIETPTPPSGIRGTVLLAPTCPGGQDPGAYDPVLCVTPYAASLVVLDAESAPVARIASGGDGKFQVDLPPGEYVVTPATGADTYPIAQPVSVIVSAGQYAEVEINYDTGIR